MAGFGQGGEFGFDLGDLVAHDEMPGLEDTLEGGGEFGFKRVILGVDVE
jgi:hypothetical protein